jgi:hypothetical protein
VINQGGEDSRQESGESDQEGWHGSHLSPARGGHQIVALLEFFFFFASAGFCSVVRYCSHTPVLLLGGRIIESVIDEESTEPISRFRRPLPIYGLVIHEDVSLARERK